MQHRDVNFTCQSPTFYKCIAFILSPRARASMYISFYEVALECTREFSPPRAHKKYPRAESAIHIAAYALYKEHICCCPVFFRRNAFFNGSRRIKGNCALREEFLSSSFGISPLLVAAACAAFTCALLAKLHYGSRHPSTPQGALSNSTGTACVFHL
jgi:hypothetical protein